MRGRIPRAFVDDLVARADIVDVIGKRVTLTGAGRDYKALCPFHEEKTPSFTVSAQKGFYHCFGCGEGGNAIGFLMKYESLDFVDAVEALAEMLGMEIPREAQAGRSDTASGGLYELLGEADRIYRAALKGTGRAKDYLRNRGIDGATAARFGMGYAPDAWDTLLRALGTDAARRQRLIDAGLAIRNDQGREYDRFRNRIMFPIRDARGRVSGFGGRVLGADEPKYVNSPETPIFHKGQALYGVYEARHGPGRRAGQPDEVLIVEGYLDVASLAQHGIGPAVATLGTATTDEHILRLTRMAQRLVFCFDGDRAGRAAAWKAMETALPHAGGRVELKFLLLPEGEDPDSLVRSAGTEAFLDLVRSAAPLSEFLLGELKRGVDLSGADGQSRLVALAQPLVSRLPAGVYRDLLTRELAQVVGIGVDGIERAFVRAEGHPSEARLPEDQRAARGRAASGPVGAKPPGTLIRRAIGLVLNYPAVGAKLAEIPDFPDLADLAGVGQPGARLLQEMIRAAIDAPEIAPPLLIERFRDDPEGRHLGRLLEIAPLETEDAAANVLRDMLERIVAQDRRQRLEALLSRASLSAPERAEIEALQECFRGSQRNLGRA